MTTTRMRDLKLSLILACGLFVVTTVATVLVIVLGSHEMSWGERISRRESYVYVNGETLPQSDLAYIAGLRRLTNLTLINCDVAECRLPELAFASKRLSSVDLSGTRGLWDLSFLKTLPAQDLVLSDCPGVSDLTMLNLEALESLEVDGTEVSDLSPLAGSHVTRLSFAHTAVSDLTPLAGLDDLWWIDGSYTQVDSIDALADFGGLWRVRFDGCPIGDVTAEFQARYLCELSLSHVGASDLSGFAGCTGIERLDVGGNPALADLSWLDRDCCGTLTSLDLGQTGVEADALSWIGSCTGLEELTVDGIALGNLDLCRRLSGLKLVSAIDCGLTDVSGLSGCTKLTTILLGFNELTSLEGLPPLDGESLGLVLDLSYNRLTSLRDLPAVQYRGLLIQGNESGLGKTMPRDLEAYDLVMDWYEGMEDGLFSDRYSYAEIYLLGCPRSQREAVDSKLGSWLVTHVREDELFDLLERDELAYGLWVDLSDYVEIARAKRG